MISPDVGGVLRARALAKPINAELAIIDKRRAGHNVAESLTVIGDVAGKTAILIDDLIQEITKEYNITMVQLAHAFVNSRPFITSNIIGATTMEQLKENIGSIDISLTEEMMEKINLIHNNNPNPSP